MIKLVSYLLASSFCAHCLLAQEKTTAAKSSSVIDPKNFDTSVKPQDDFFDYANGGWIKRNPVPPEFSRWGAFDELNKNNKDALHEIAEKAAAAKPNEPSAIEKAAASDLQKVGDFYASGMDEKAIQAARAKPLEDEFKRIAAMKDRVDLLKEIAHLHLLNINAIFGFGAGQDDRNSEMVIGQATQGGLALPDRDYYTKDDEASKKLREQYVLHMTSMFKLVGESATVAADHAKKVLAIETSLATPAMTRVELRNPQAIYNKMSVAQLQTLTPDWPWNDYLKEIGLVEPGEINVRQPAFFKAINQVLTATPLDDWKTYLRWQVLTATSGALSNDFVDEHFKFYGATLTGAKQLKPRWKRVVEAIDGGIGHALGKLYVAEHFPPAAKAGVLEMVDNMKVALADRIKTLEWMDEPTKQEALKKLSAFGVKMGYPDKWRDYSSLQIDRGPYVLNILRSAAHESKRQLARIGKPVDRSEWQLTPPEVNAYYDANLNEIVFAAGILQPPFYDPKADDAVNYGGIGSVIGHEMTHGFDDEGREYDAVGNLRDWWSPASKKAYDERRQTVIAQYSAYEPVAGVHLNGDLTQGENIADIGGVKIAYAALKKSLAKKGSAPKIDGFTPEQRFFLGYAQVWRSAAREEDAKLRVNVDPHSPGRFRTNGPLANLDEFAQAFDVPVNARMMRPLDQRVNIW